jgi:hypothetical protein
MVVMNSTRVADLEASSKLRVFHGTNKEAAQLIKKNGFDINKSQDVDYFTQVQTILGRCIYFAPDRFKAAYIAKQKFGEDKAVVLEYVLNVGKMHMTGSPCYDWQEEFDTCFLFGMRSERKSKDTPVATHVQYDEVGVSPRVLGTHLEFIAMHDCKQNKYNQYPRMSKVKWKKKADSEKKSWKPAWYSWDSEEEKKPTDKVFGRKSKKFNRNKKKKKKLKAPKGYCAAETPLDLPDVVSTRDAKYVASSKESHVRITKKREDESPQSYDDNDYSVQSQNADKFTQTKDKDTYYVYIPDELLCPKGYASAPMESINDETASEPILPVKEMDGAPNRCEKAMIDTDIEFRAIESKNMKADPGKYLEPVSGKETEEECFMEEEEFEDISVSYNDPAVDVDSGSSSEDELESPKLTSEAKMPIVPLVLPQVVNIGLPLASSITYLASPLPILLPPPPMLPLPLLCPSPPKLADMSKSLCNMNSNGGSEFAFGTLLGEKGC